MKIKSITQGDQQIRCCLYHKFKPPTTGNANLNQDQFIFQRHLKTDLITFDLSKFKKLIFQYNLNEYQL